ncbi:unnamed protein product, partial [Meganyctiphanes norvegica]
MDVTECEICCNIFKSVNWHPRTLPCGHIYCHLCMTKEIRNGKKTCPTCRMQHNAKRVEDLPVCILVERLIENITQTKSLNVGANACVPEANEEDDYSEGPCSTHKKSFLYFYCDTHSLKICKECTIIDHPVTNCNIISFKEEVERRKGENIQQTSSTITDVNDTISALGETIKENKDMVSKQEVKIMQLEKSIEDERKQIAKRKITTEKAKELMNQGKIRRRHIEDAQKNLQQSNTKKTIFKTTNEIRNVQTNIKNWIQDVNTEFSIQHKSSKEGVYVLLIIHLIHQKYSGKFGGQPYNCQNISRFEARMLPIYSNFSNYAPKGGIYSKKKNIHLWLCIISIHRTTPSICLPFGDQMKAALSEICELGRSKKTFFAPIALKFGLQTTAKFIYQTALILIFFKYYAPDILHIYYWNRQKTQVPSNRQKTQLLELSKDQSSLEPSTDPGLANCLKKNLINFELGSDKGISEYLCRLDDIKATLIEGSKILFPSPENITGSDMPEQKYFFRSGISTFNLYYCVNVLRMCSATLHADPFAGEIFPCKSYILLVLVLNLILKKDLFFMKKYRLPNLRAPLTEPYNFFVEVLNTLKPDDRPSYDLFIIQLKAKETELKTSQKDMKIRTPTARVSNQIFSSNKKRTTVKRKRDSERRAADEQPAGCKHRRVQYSGRRVADEQPAGCKHGSVKCSGRRDASSVQKPHNKPLIINNDALHVPTFNNNVLS